MLSIPQTTGRGRKVRFVARKQKRNPRKLLESVPEDWERWGRAAKLEGLNWSEFTRRALNERTERVLLEHAPTRKKAKP